MCFKRAIRMFWQIGSIHSWDRFVIHTEAKQHKHIDNKGIRMAQITNRETRKKKNVSPIPHKPSGEIQAAEMTHTIIYLFWR